MKLPERFATYLQANNIDPEIYSIEGRKFFYSEVDMDDLLRDFKGAGVEKCSLVPNFYSTRPDFAFSESKLYQDGLLLPMDVSSGLAVNLLELSATDHVLDLCCAPGGKLVLAGLLMGREFAPEAGTITGVDIAEHRLFTCRSMLKKYKIPRTRLFCADGTTFDARVARFGGSQVGGKTGVRALHETTDFRKRPTIQTDDLYDKVIVDAQCTHDGSIKHIRKHMVADWKGFDLDQFTPERLKELHDLQLRLLENGFRMLKPGGVIVYSTCSLSRDQNEGIIEKFLERHEDAEPYPFDGNHYFQVMRPPSHDSGFFVSRFRKARKENE